MRSRWKDVKAATDLSARAKVRGSPLRVFDSYSRGADGEESEDEEERLLYFLMENEFFSGRTCTLTPDRALAGVQAMPAAAVVKKSPTVEAATSPARDALRQHKGLSQLPSRSELLDVSASDSGDEGEAKPPKPPPKPRPASPPGAPVDDGWARRWQPNPSEEQVLAAADRLLLTQARRCLRAARLRRGMRGLIGLLTKAMERLSWNRQEQYRVLAQGWAGIRRASARLANLAILERTLRTSRLAKALLAWRSTWRRQAERRLLLLTDSFRRMWVHTHTQRLARTLLSDEEGREQWDEDPASHGAVLSWLER
tara:strand:- start:773 stop:1708 length:936 start_codon:yes stop_codon:yes gene_type:complete